MRSAPLALLAVAALVALAPATAQGDDCSDPDSPCVWVVVIDPEDRLTFGGEADWSFTQDEWVELTVTNLDEAPRTVTVQGYDIQLTAPGDDEANRTFQLTAAGDFRIGDDQGRSAILHVVPGDFVDEESPTTGTTTSKGTPGLGAAFLLAGLAIALVARRR